MEARALTVGGFNEFSGAFKYCEALANGGIVDQATIWNWILVGLGEVRSQKKGGKADIDFLTHRMKAGIMNHIQVITIITPLPVQGLSGTGRYPSEVVPENRERAWG